MSGTVWLSVVVPAHQAESLLGDTLGALVASDLPRDEWELIVVDDASEDRTSAVAGELADRVMTLKGRPAGPGAARNAGAAVARGQWLLFVDADVRVHSDTLSRLAATVRGRDDLAAVFGSYDARPAAAGSISAYRNLLHRYVHLRGAGQAETFWAGLGAVRRSWFLRIGGFDTDRYPRPQIEDIHLGYRIRDAGGRILLDPAIQGTHLKRWTWKGMVRTDLLDRGIPWMRLLLERSAPARTSLNVTMQERVKVALAGLMLLTPLMALLLRRPWPLAVGLGLAGVLVLWSLPFARWMARERGLRAGLLAVPLHLSHYVTNAVAAVSGLVLHALSRLRKVPSARTIPSL